MVLAADGLGGALLARAGLTEAPAEPGSRMGAGVVLTWDGPFYEPGTVYMACGRAGYVGLVRLEDGRLDVAAALDAPAVRAPTGRAAWPKAYSGRGGLAGAAAGGWAAMDGDAAADTPGPSTVRPSRVRPG